MRRQKDSNTGIEENNTPENPEDPEAPVEPTSEHDDWEDGQVNPDDLVENEGLEDSNYLPTSEEDVASVTNISSFQRNPSNKSALSAG